MKGKRHVRPCAVCSVPAFVSPAAFRRLAARANAFPENVGIDDGGDGDESVGGDIVTLCRPLSKAQSSVPATAVFWR